MSLLRLAAAALGGVLLMAALPGHAQEGPPPLRPERDVVITYRHPGAMPAGFPELQTRTFISAATRRQRLENAGVVGILDPQAKRRYMFVTSRQDPAAGTVTEFETDDEMDLAEAARDPDFRVTRLGEARFAGAPCTLWRVRIVQEPEEEAETVCVTADGLPLLIESQRQGMTSRQEAIRIDYGALDPALFALPAGWPVQRQTLPQAPSR